jgi:hypothetical protein
MSVQAMNLVVLVLIRQCAKVLEHRSVSASGGSGHAYAYR